MALVVKVAATEQALSLDEAKTHMRPESSFVDDDDYILALIKAAAYQIETATNRSLVKKTYQLYADAFPGTSDSVSGNIEAEILTAIGAGEQQVLPVPLVSLDLVTYVDTNGATQTLDAAKYIVDAKSEPARVTPAYGETWPSTRAQINAVIWEFTAGYATAADVPAGLKQVLKYLVSNWYEWREPVVNGIVSSVPKTVEYLTMPFKVWRFA